jgi:hypothetical protein
MDEKPSAAEREKLYTEYLKVEGFQPDPDEDGVVCFYKGDHHLHLPIDQDPDFFILSLLDVLPEDEAIDPAKLARAANMVTADSKVAKVCLSPAGEVVINVELFCTPPEAFKAIFARCLSELEAAHDKFHKAYAG